MESIKRGPQRHETATEVQRRSLVTTEATPVQIPAEGKGMIQARCKFCQDNTSPTVRESSAAAGMSTRQEDAAVNIKYSASRRKILSAFTEDSRPQARSRTTWLKRIKQEEWTKAWRNSKKTMGPRRQFALFPKEMCWHATDHRQPSNVK